MSEPKFEDLRKTKKDRIDATIPGGLAQLRTDFQNATSVPQMKAVLAKILKILIDL